MVDVLCVCGRLIPPLSSLTHSVYVSVRGVNECVFFNETRRVRVRVKVKVRVRVKELLQRKYLLHIYSQSVTWGVAISLRLSSEHPSGLKQTYLRYIHVLHKSYPHSNPNPD